MSHVMRHCHVGAEASTRDCTHLEIRVEQLPRWEVVVVLAERIEAHFGHLIVFIAKHRVQQYGLWVCKCRIASIIIVN